MNKEQLRRFIKERYDVEDEYPWLKYPGHAVFRHLDNRKWFALVMSIPQQKLGLPGNEMIDVVNVKCDPALIGALQREPGIFPAYHMNKANWLTLALDGSLEEDNLLWLLDMSYQLTAGKKESTKR